MLVHVSTICLAIFWRYIRYIPWNEGLIGSWHGHWILEFTEKNNANWHDNSQNRSVTPSKSDYIGYFIAFYHITSFSDLGTASKCAWWSVRWIFQVGIHCQIKQRWYMGRFVDSFVHLARGWCFYTTRSISVWILRLDKQCYIFSWGNAWRLGGLF